MFFINKLKFFHIVLFTIILFLSTFKISNSYGNTFKVSEIEVTEQFDLKFNKKNVFDKAFKSAFYQLISMVTSTADRKKLKNTDLSTIKTLIDSFNISNERFTNEKYIAVFNVNFDKKNTLLFFESQNIFPSIPKKLDVLLVPILVDVGKEHIVLYNENPFFKIWNDQKQNFHLLNYILPDEDIEDIKFLNRNYEIIENYDYSKIIEKYALKNFIINIIYKYDDKITILSKIKLKDTKKTINLDYKNIDYDSEDSLLVLIDNLKNIYEDNWKRINEINTSIKLPITVSIETKSNKKITRLEKELTKMDLVSSYKVLSVDSKKILYKIIYNGSPKNFLLEIEESGLEVNKDNQIWKIQ